MNITHLPEEAIEQARDLILTEEFRALSLSEKFEAMVLHGLVSGAHPGLIAIRDELAALQSNNTDASGLEKGAAGPWVKLSQKNPPVNQQVLIRQKEAVGEVYDVACFVGKQPDGELRWVMADIRLESRQITQWALINDGEEHSTDALRKEADDLAEAVVHWRNRACELEARLEALTASRPVGERGDHQAQERGQ